MKSAIKAFLTSLGLMCSPLFAQTNEWATEYVTLDTPENGTGLQTSSVAVVGPNQFIALVSGDPPNGREDLFNLSANYLVGYLEADSVFGILEPRGYGSSAEGIFDQWISGFENVPLNGAWQMAAGGPDNYVYIANNDERHNILVFALDIFGGVMSTDFRMETGDKPIFAIEVDDAGYVYVADYQGSDEKTNEVKVYAPIGADGTTWGDEAGRNDDPVATIDLPPGVFQGLTVNNDGSQVFVSFSSERSLLKFTGSPQSGYTQDLAFNVALAEDDTISNGGSGTPSFLGLAYAEASKTLFATVDDFIAIGTGGGYPYGRIYVIDGEGGSVADTVDIAEWNFAQTGFYNTGSNNGSVGGFTSVTDCEVIADEPNVVYTQTYYGWAVEKWAFDGDLSLIVSVEQSSGALPQTFSLSQNYPNPFNPQTRFTFEIPEQSRVKIEVFNLLGEHIATLADGELPDGVYRGQWNGRSEAGLAMPSGLYFLVMRADDFQQQRRMILMR